MPTLPSLASAPAARDGVVTPVSWPGMPASGGPTPANAPALTGSGPAKPPAALASGPVQTAAVPQPPPVIPPLETFEVIMSKALSYQGPTPESNWVLPGRLLVGAYPSSMDDAQNTEIITSILELGVTTFICLQQEFQLNAPEYMWRNGLALRPYIADALAILQRMEAMRTANPSLPPHDPPVVASVELDFVHFPIVDCAVVEDNSVLQLAQNVADRLRRGEVIYLHCWGGHGRTGTVVCILLHLLYGMTADQVLEYCQFVHDLRACYIDVGSPQTLEQRQQVRRVIQAVSAATAARAAQAARARAAPVQQQQQQQQPPPRMQPQPLQPQPSAVQKPQPQPQPRKPVVTKQRQSRPQRSLAPPVSVIATAPQARRTIKPPTVAQAQAAGGGDVMPVKSGLAVGLAGAAVGTVTGGGRSGGGGKADAVRGATSATTTTTTTTTSGQQPKRPANTSSKAPSGGRWGGRRNVSKPVSRASRISAGSVRTGFRGVS